MNKILNASIHDFVRELSITENIVAKKVVEEELILFRNWLSSFYVHVRNELSRLQFLLSLEEEDIYPDIFNKFSLLQRDFQIVGRRFLPGIYRSHVNDKLVLRVLDWLHKQHDQTKGKAFFVMDGDFAIAPTVDFPVNYYLPIASQQSLLYLPLFFHELGHYLYQYHNAEMDELVKALQIKLEDYLTLPMDLNSGQHKEAVEKSRKIIETWYEWAQEMFCDAVGLEIGGITYLKAFSYYLRMNGRSAFFQPEKELLNSSHPVTWLRIKFLVQRAKVLGLIEEANQLESDWQKIAQTLNIQEEYFGFFSDNYFQDIVETLNDMVTEANPIRFADYLKNCKDINIEDDPNYICLIHEAWVKFEESPENFSTWELDKIEGFKGFGQASIAKDAICG